MASEELIVQIDARCTRDLDQVAEDLSRAGLSVRRKLRRSRTVVGTADSAVKDRLRAIDGVAAIRAEGKVRLPPMDEKIPQ